MAIIPLMTIYQFNCTRPMGVMVGSPVCYFLTDIHNRTKEESHILRGFSSPVEAPGKGAK